MDKGPEFEGLYHLAGVALIANLDGRLGNNRFRFFVRYMD
jgi:hypothetical protein